MKKIISSFICSTLIILYSISPVNAQQIFKPELEPYGDWFLVLTAGGPHLIQRVDIVHRADEATFLELFLEFNLFIDEKEFTVEIATVGSVSKQDPINLSFIDKQQIAMEIAECDIERCKLKVKNSNQSLIEIFKNQEDLIEKENKGENFTGGQLSFTDRKTQKPIEIPFYIKGINEGLYALEKAQATYEKSNKMAYVNQIMFDHEWLSDHNGETTLEGQLVNAIENTEDIWLMAYYFSPTADPNKNVIIVFPDGTQQQLPVNFCTKTSCQAILDGEKAKEAITHWTLIKKNYPSQSVNLTYIDKKTGKETSVSLSPKI